jgi:oxalate decarboxylase
MFGSHGRYRTEALDQGDVASIPQGYGHSVENTSSKTARMLIGFNTGTHQAIDLSQWIAGVPASLLAGHFGKPQALFGQFPKERVFIAPPDGQGQREIK